MFVSRSRHGYPIYVHLDLGQVVVDHELFYHDTFSAYPVCVSILHGYGQCWKILALGKFSNSHLFLCEYVRPSLYVQSPFLLSYF